MSKLTEEQRTHIDTTWRAKWDGIVQAQNQVLNWLFAVHGGGIAGVLTFAASEHGKGLCSVKVGLGAFSLGLFLLVMFGVCMFYFESRGFFTFRNEVNELFAGNMDWTEYSKRREKEPDKYRTCEILAWGSGACGVVGIVAAIVAIT